MLRRSYVLTSIAFVLSTLGATDAGASAQRTFVASHGASTNTAFNCSIVKPCRAFSEALDLTSAGGEVIVLDSAGYGPVTITQSVSLIAPAGVYAGITVFSGDGITINAPGGIVVLRGLSINGQGGSNGVNVLQAARVRIESCVISKMAVDGVMHSASGAELIVLDTIVRDNGGSGIGGDADAALVLDHVRSEHNGTNGFYLASVTVQARAMISDSVFAFNGSNGVWVAAPNFGQIHARIERSVLADNGGVGIRIGAGAATSSHIEAAVTRNAIHGNAGDGVVVTGPGGAIAWVAENAFSAEAVLRADGSQAVIVASANTGAVFVQSNGAGFYSFRNNAVLGGIAIGAIDTFDLF